MTMVGYNDGTHKDFYCGGSLISEKFVLTAAHCKFNGRGQITNYVRFNATLRNSKFAIDRFVENFIVHTDYAKDRDNHDIALMKLRQSFNFNIETFVVPACLYTRNEGAQNKATATGWGRTSFASDPSEVLQKVSLDMISCKTKNSPRINFVKTICTDGSGKDTCGGGDIEMICIAQNSMIIIIFTLSQILVDHFKLKEEE